MLVPLLEPLLPTPTPPPAASYPLQVRSGTVLLQVGSVPDPSLLTCSVLPWASVRPLRTLILFCFHISSI